MTNRRSCPIPKLLVAVARQVVRSLLNAGFAEDVPGESTTGVTPGAPARTAERSRCRRPRSELPRSQSRAWPSAQRRR
jgi:hypothetical protein